MLKKSLAVALMLVAALGSRVQADIYPSKFITMVVPFAAGSGSDTAARIVAQSLGAFLGQTVIIENRVGATGEVAATAVAHAPPDGYTLLVGTNSSHGSNPAIYKKLTYDPIKDFVAIAPLGVFTYDLVVNPQLPVKTPQELVSYARANPGKVSFAFGSSTSLVMAETFAKGTQTQLLKIPYRSNPPAITDVVSGRVSMMFVDISSVSPFVKSGQLRALAITSRARSALAPDLPTIQETILPDFHIESWVGFLAPAGTPAPIVDKLNAAFTAVLQEPEVKKHMADLGVDILQQSPEAFAGFVQDSVDRFTRLTKDAGIEPQ